MALVLEDQLEVVCETSELGGVAVAMLDGRLAATAFGHRSAGAAERDVRRRVKRRKVCAAAYEAEGDRVDAAAVLERIRAYAAGEPTRFDDLPLYERNRTSFQRRVVAACRAIPRGATRTYGELAAAVGNPGAARAVGTVMSSNPTPLIVPCHRVLAAGGRLGGYSARQGLAMKRRLLAMEAGA